MHYWEYMSLKVKGSIKIAPPSLPPLPCLEMGLKEHQNAKKKKMESTVAEHTHHSIHWEVTTMPDHGRVGAVVSSNQSVWILDLIVHAVVVSYRVLMMTVLCNNFHSSSQSHQPFSNKSCSFGCCWHDCIKLHVVVSCLLFVSESESHQAFEEFNSAWGVSWLIWLFEVVAPVLYPLL